MGLANTKQGLCTSCVNVAKRLANVANVAKISGVHGVYKIIGDLGKSKVSGVTQPTAVGSGINEKERQGNSN